MGLREICCWWVLLLLASACGQATRKSESSTTGQPGETSGCSGAATRCGSECVDIMTSVVHCGACNESCATNEICSLGGCVPVAQGMSSTGDAAQSTLGAASSTTGGSASSAGGAGVGGAATTTTTSTGAGGATAAAGGSGGAGGASETSTGETSTGEGTTATGTTGEGGSGEWVNTEGPCDIYEAAGTPCAAAYSMVRRLSSAYTGPLYQVRSGSSAQNTGSGGELHDIEMTEDGFGDAAAQDALCSDSICSVSLLYDQSGNGNHLPVAPAGLSSGGEFADEPDFESLADAGPLTVGGHPVYSLYMEARQGYRLPDDGIGVPQALEPQGIYLLADGTHYGTSCCWSFGNADPDPKTFSSPVALSFGCDFWGTGAGDGPWFLGDFGAGLWAGGSNPGDPGWGQLGSLGPPNPNNPSLRVPFAVGFLKTSQQEWSLRMADAAAATSITTAYTGAAPKPLYNAGGVVLGVSQDNANNSWGTFYEGVVVAGYPSEAAELGVLENLRAVGYGQ